MKIELGVRGHDLSQSNIENLAINLKEEGFSHMQLALNKALSDYNGFQNKINVGMMSYFKNELNKYNLRVSVLGCYINMAQPNLEKRKNEIEYFKENIRYASDIGCKLVGTETGCFTEDYSYTPLNDTEEAYGTFLSTLKEIVVEAEKFGVIVAIEAVTWHIVNTPEKMKKALDTINSNNLQVILDVVNLLDKDNYLKQDEIIKKSFELFGDKINAIHVNDCIFQNGEKKVVDVGKGILNYKLIMNLIKTYRPHVDLLLENYNRGTKEEICRYLEDCVKD